MFHPLQPPEGAKTVWEDRCKLVHFDNAKDVSGLPKLLPSVLLANQLPQELLPHRAVVYPPDASSGDVAEDGSSRSPLLERLASPLQAALTRLSLGAPLTFLWSRFLSGCQSRDCAPPLEWHPRQPLLAAADPRGRVQLIDLLPGPGSSRPGGGSGRGGLGGGSEVLTAGPGSLRAVLSHEALRQQAWSLAWCPTSPGLLAVGSAGAVGLWAVAGEARPPLAAAGRSAGPWLRLLRTWVRGARVTSLSWSPDGRLLAAASPNQAGLQVWDVHSGDSTRVGAGPAAFDLVRWSPCANYVFAAGTGSRHFYVFETERWRWARWQIADSSTSSSSAAAAAAAVAASAAAAAGGGRGPGGEAAAASRSGPQPAVLAAAWAPAAPGRPPVLLAALSGLSYLVTVHLVDAPPGLTAQLLPVALPDLHRPAVSSGAFRGSHSSPAVADLAWEPRGERLAVLLAPETGQEAPCVALYGTLTDPLVSARLIGLARPPQRLLELAAAAAGGGPPPGEGPEPPGGAAAAPSTASAGGETSQPASLLSRPGALAAVRLAPWAAGGSAPELPSCIVSARVGERVIYNLPCYI